MSILGLHHVTLVTSDAQRNVDFYTGTLGLRLVKKTVNFDDPSAYHLYYGSADAAPGSLVTFFEWPDAAKGWPGVGGTHHIAFRVRDFDTLLRWKRYLNDSGIATFGPYDRRYFVSLYLRDPEGQTLELATDGPGFTVDEPEESLGETFLPAAEVHQNGSLRRDAIEDGTWPEPVPELLPEMRLEAGMHHLSAIASDIEATHRFLHEVLGLRRVKRTDNFDIPGSLHHYWGDESGQPGTLVTYFEHPARNARRASLGAGQTHHYALAVDDEETQLSFREKLMEAGHRVSPVRDRIYFKSIYTSDPDGHIVEIATRGPGFSVDESPETLGTRLMLPPWLEAQRAQIESNLKPLEMRNAGGEVRS